jgi:hypothetical protein
MCKKDSNPEEDYKELQSLMDKKGWDIQSIKNLFSNKVDKLCGYGIAKFVRGERTEDFQEVFIELKKQVSTILQEKGKIHHKTLQKINNQLTNNINNQLTNNINNGSINNGKIINNTFVKFGDVEYERILNNKQVKHILNQQFMSIEESIKLVHFNFYTFKSISILNGFKCK